MHIGIKPMCIFYFARWYKNTLNLLYILKFNNTNLDKNLQIYIIYDIIKNGKNKKTFIY